eukprot:CAMPEP_0119152432 /NCGR_PEP_ID=MMETSP1310-20130426/47793_1 /TAXON_ID=464262 /ORGANISM="Genus nov. species nov., Strain RCC2339" /LENGTH=394 /DNA_ID=CAMNT_0007144793 /DNA_START=55 /DNA_END=1235 /DNA_ORIENTATION=+
MEGRKRTRVNGKEEWARETKRARGNNSRVAAGSGPVGIQTHLRKRGTEFQCNTRMRNDLPDIPFGPKFLVYPFDNDRMGLYQPSTLEREYKRTVMAGPLMGVGLNMVDPDLYRVKEDAVTLDPADERLFGKGDAGQGRSLQRTTSGGVPNVSWLRRTAYMTAAVEQVYGRERGGAPADSMEETMKVLDQEKAVAMVEETFAGAKRDPVHPTKPDMKPVAVVPILPWVDMWANNVTRVIFDQVPCPSQEGADGSQSAVEDPMERAILVPSSVQEDKEVKVLTLFLPVEGNAKAGKGSQEQDDELDDLFSGDSDEEDKVEGKRLELKFHRSYAYSDPYKGKKGRSIILVVPRGGGEARYCPTSNTLLKKKKQRSQRTAFLTADISRSEYDDYKKNL